ncbi:MAG: hypothetical protein A2350_03465 [Candidatus Raymondbacteria bacterium RifOxyB12_full_50_8]|uniref:DUF5683 domain-containing protein n=1 Tax=Candidatus Raymondbacteria bacterium RIFOXYD12_FULL_49_13 TaxID=1817890 RepID=A0A1F7F7J7_UNCRA|nr:MAG: hypothetical protein A2248_21880 [Candidatus Raymondbacteria bacterium RIFOXYA2_FULL_49_16]OGJ96268.1 MAG: hypothetical protein A2453_08750 [Candidatus Raymondbacteria bacterium RIFOXYC2_FULL_50_21]OGK00349.1 MAG: hypothetical protein A2350_03465 [Candidatus Raymondbacteria bacterium RifOxyB12_full_50_8]OGK02476.1 MAG: hypothetical protein A2519_12095 [Candidatus Raymondbacteria bacterium RIFOXYD12_FULL_49_13]OGP41308.1 MAG: hypothetical protein A2324_01625 [Candidatus Raymondbacteria b
MKILLAIFACIAGLAYADEEQKELVPAKTQDPAYKVLFESGFYNEAIDYLEAKILDRQDSGRQDYMRYLAFSYILVNRLPEARAVFSAMLDEDSTFVLDSVLTAPNLYDVFTSARIEWRTRHSLKPAEPGSEAAPAASLRPADTVPLVMARSGASWYRAPVCLLPAGAGQFQAGSKVKGGAMLVVQTLALGVSIWAYNKRQNYYHPDYGWYAGNIDENRTYGNLYRASFGVFAGAYLYSIVDGFLSLRGQAP